MLKNLKYYLFITIATLVQYTDAVIHPHRYLQFCLDNAPNANNYAYIKFRVRNNPNVNQFFHGYSTNTCCA